MKRRGVIWWAVSGGFSSVCNQQSSLWALHNIMQDTGTIHTWPNQHKCTTYRTRHPEGLSFTSQQVLPKQPSCRTKAAKTKAPTKQTLCTVQEWSTSRAVLMSISQGLSNRFLSLLAFRPYNTLRRHPRNTALYVLMIGSLQNNKCQQLPLILQSLLFLAMAFYDPISSRVPLSHSH